MTTRVRTFQQVRIRHKKTLLFLVYRTLFTSPPRPTSRTHPPLGATTARTQTTAHNTISQCPKMPVISTTSDDLGSNNRLRHLTPGYHKKLGRTSSTRKSQDSLVLNEVMSSLFPNTKPHPPIVGAYHQAQKYPFHNAHSETIGSYLSHLLLNDPARAPKNKLAQNEKLNTRKRPPLISPSSPSTFRVQVDCVLGGFFGIALDAATVENDDGRPSFLRVHHFRTPLLLHVLCRTPESDRFRLS